MVHAVPVLLFGPGLPHAGVATTCAINEHSISIASHQLAVPLSALKADIGGFDHDQLQLHWQGTAGAYMVIAGAPDAQKQLLGLLPAPLVAGLKGWRIATFSQKNSMEQFDLRCRFDCIACMHRGLAIRPYVGLGC
jgi:hypothetical protein